MQGFVICFDVSAELVDQASHERHVSIRGCGKQGSKACAVCTINIGTMLLDQEAQNCRSVISSRVTR
jgi:hypothetical protein